MSIVSYQPAPDENLGDYVKRLRVAAAEVQGAVVTLEDVARQSSHLPTGQRFTAAWLNMLEANGYKQPGGEKLRVLADIYSRLLASPIPPEWVLALAGYEVISPPPRRVPDDELLAALRQDERIVSLVAAAKKLVDMGHPEDVELLIVLAQRYISARDPNVQLGDTFNDATLSAHVINFMQDMGLQTQ